MTAAVLATILFSLSAVSGKRLSHHLSGVEANFWRFLLAGALLGIYAHSMGAGLGGGALGVFFISGIVGFGMGDYGLFRAFPILGSRLTMVMTQCLAAPFAATIEWLWLGERLSLGQVLAGTAILVGVGLALAPSETSQVDKRSEEHTSELQSRRNLVCRLLLDKKKNKEIGRAPSELQSRLNP